MTYLYDGTKGAALDAEGKGYRYAGSFRFLQTASRALVLESAASAGGRIVNVNANPDGSVSSTTPDLQVRYFITDHLGSVRLVADAAGNVLERNDFLPFGEKCQNNGLVSAENPYLYGGKELQTFFGIDWYDSGARFQTTHGTFSSLDPMSESYYPISPYAYCAGDPVNLIDPEGRELWVWDSKESRNIRYKEGKLYYSNGETYMGNNEFVIRVKVLLNKLYDLNDSYINEVLSKIENNSFQNTLSESHYHQDGVGTRLPYDDSLANIGLPVVTHTYLYLDLDIVDGYKATPLSILAHEIKHIYDYNQGRMKGLIGNNPDAPAPNPSEVSAVNFENRVRVRTELPLRKRYDTMIPQSKLENPWKHKTDKK